MSKPCDLYKSVNQCLHPSFTVPCLLQTTSRHCVDPVSEHVSLVYNSLKVGLERIMSIRCSLNLVLLDETSLRVLSQSGMLDF